MKNSSVLIFVAFLLVVTNAAVFADTLKNLQTKEVLHGYATSRTINDKTIVHTQESNDVALNLGDYDITPDALGRNNKVIVITIDGAIEFEHTTKALEQAFAKDADKGPLFILLEIDTPGGRLSLAQRISAAITKTNNCRIICFINGGEYGGAISAGVAVALACNKIYMADNTVLGGATPIVISKQGPQELEKAFGAAVGEKFNSIWRANLASLAERNGRPALLARAMVDKDIEVIEVADVNGKRSFINPAEKKTQQNFVKTWNAKDSLLTLTASEAAQCGMADKVVNSRQDLLADMKTDKAQIVVDDSFQQAKNDIKRAELGLNRLRQSVDLKIKYLQNEQSRAKALGYVREIRTDFQNLVALAKKYPDLHLDVEGLQAELNSVEAAYQHAMTSR
jgi:membrane-bound ClpP family serine protease